MPLVTTHEMLKHAQDNKYAVAAFNVENMEMVQAVISAADEIGAPVILQTTSSTLKYGSPELYASMVSALANKTHVPVALHLDHGSSYELCQKCISAGYTSIMFDGSKLPLEDNIKETAKAAKLCADNGIALEGELGQVGGKEDDVESEGGGYTIPSEAIRFEAESGLYSMAVGVGTAHGVYAVAPVLKTALIKELSGMLKSPLVLHGASGLSDESIKECINNGICKVNFATDLRIAFTKGVKGTIEVDPKVIDPKTYGAKGRENVKALVIDRMQVCGGAGRFTK